MTQEDLKELLKERELEDTLLFEDPSYCTACIGLSPDDRLIYSYDKMIKFLMEEDDMTQEDAMDWISYNTERALPYAEKDGKTPIICCDFGNMFE